RFHRLWEEGIPQNTIAQPEFESVEWHVVEQALRAQVVQYRESVFSLQPVEVKDLLPLVQYLGVARLRRADAVADLYERTGRILFEPMCVRGSSWFLAPPV